MVGNPQGRDRGLATLKKADANKVWNKGYMPKYTGMRDLKDHVA
jgi:hypothetical protein